MVGDLGPVLMSVPPAVAGGCTQPIDLATDQGVRYKSATRTEIILSCVLGFVTAVTVEFILLLPGLALIGTHTRADSPLGRDMHSYLVAVHLPTVAITWGLSGTFFFPDDITDFTPLTQIVFWTFVFAFAFRFWLTRRTPKLP
jgi:hypothetical protein